MDQQTEKFQKYLGSAAVSGVSGETAHTLELSTLLKEKSVMVMTAQVLVNAFEKGILSLADIGMLILDECHNCQVSFLKYHFVTNQRPQLAEYLKDYNYILNISMLLILLLIV